MTNQDKRSATSAKPATARVDKDPQSTAPIEPGEPESASDFRGDFSTGAGGRLNSVAPDEDTARAGGPVVVRAEDVAEAAEAAEARNEATKS